MRGLLNRSAGQSRNETINTGQQQIFNCNASLSSQLDNEISQSEIINAIESLKKGKAAGPDGLPSDIFHQVKGTLVNFLHPLFNRIFDSGAYLESWARAVISPLQKKGNTRLLGSYRGISLLSIINKIYGTVINNRLSHVM